MYNLNEDMQINVQKVILSIGLVCCTSVAAIDYDPLNTKIDPGSVKTLDTSFTYGKQEREIPVLVYLPSSAMKAPVVIFSHGLGGSRKGSAFLGKHWAACGYVAVFIQHPGSDQSVMEGLPPLKRYAALKKAASLKSTLDRVRDVPALIDQLGRWNKEPDHSLMGRVDLKRIGMSGHSFGAITTQYVSGQSVSLRRQDFVEKRIRAALPMSPSGPRRGEVEKAFAKVSIPWLLMTGTEDDSPIGDFEPEDRLKVFPALPPEGKYELVLWRAEHSAFTERRLPGDPERRNPNHHKVILALSTAFWDAYLQEDPETRKWLDGDGPKSVMEPKDRWQRK